MTRGRVNGVGVRIPQARCEIRTGPPVGNRQSSSINLLIRASANHRKGGTLVAQTDVMTVSFKAISWAALTLACSTSPDGNALASNGVAARDARLPAPGASSAEGGSAEQLEPTLSDEELQRLLDALEQEIGEHASMAR